MRSCQCFPVVSRNLKKFRAALIGDAANSVNNVGGQGSAKDRRYKDSYVSEAVDCKRKKHVESRVNATEKDESAACLIDKLKMMAYI